MAISRKTNDAKTGGVTQETFAREVKKIRAAKSKSDDARSDLGTAYQSAETWGLNRPALKLALKIEGMEDAKRNDFLADVDTYLKWLGVTFQGELFGAGAVDASIAKGATSGHAEAGYEDGLAGKAMDPTRDDWGVSGRDAYEAAWNRGQAETVSAQMQNRDAPTPKAKNGEAKSEARA